MPSLNNGATPKSLLMVLATGTGKTVIACELIRRWKKGNVLFLAHREELIFQAQDRISAYCSEPVELEMGNFRARLEYEPRIIVASVQTLISGRGEKRRMHRFNPNDFGLCVTDEAHHAVAKSYRAVYEYFGQNPDWRHVGMTATADRTDEEALGQVFDEVAFEYSILDGIDDGWLVPIKQQYVKVESLDLTNVGKNRNDLKEGELAKVMEQEANIHAIASATLQLARDRPTLCFTASVDQSIRMAEIFNRHKPGQAAAIYSSAPGRPGTSSEDRRRLVNDYLNGKIQYLCNMGIFLEGFDAVATSCISNARPTASRALYAQIVGRGTRPLAGTVDGVEPSEARQVAIAGSAKQELLVLDFVGNAGRHKLISTVDILAGNESDMVIDLAERNAKKKDGATDMRKELDGARKQLEHDASERRKHLMATANFKIKDVDPFLLFDVVPNRESGMIKGRKPTQRMRAAMIKMGLAASRVDKMSYHDAKEFFDTVHKRREEGLCTYKQARVLAKHGFDHRVTFDEASSIIDRVASSGWTLKGPLVR